MTPRVFAPGFRFSPRDAVTLVVAIAVCATVAFFDGWIAGAVAFVVGHFFLFCNILRMPRPLELIWASVFGGFAVTCVLWGWPRWLDVFIMSGCVTVIVAAIQFCRPSYHGVFWRTINPSLPQWWQSQQTQRESLNHRNEAVDKHR